MITRFRAWNKATKEICVQTIYFEQGLPDSRDLDYYDFDDIVLMQSTGLRDKNDREIFEGDVIKVNYWLEVVSFSEEKVMFVSKGIGFPETSLYDLFNSDIFTVEIIGNIYENPKLAEVGS